MTTSGKASAPAPAAYLDSTSLGTSTAQEAGTSVSDLRRPFICGLDAGATKTDCAICDRNGRMLVRTVSGGSAMLGPSEAFAHQLARVARAAIQEASIDSTDVGVFVVGLSGVDTDGGTERALMSLRRSLATDSVVVENDAANALEACTDVRPAAVVMSGTGSVAYGEDEDGRSYRVGGLGHLFSDEGSGFEIGVNALAAVLRAADGRGETTALTAYACSFYELSDARELVDLTARLATDPSLAAAFAPTVCEAAAAGDHVSTTIIERAARDLVALTVSLGDKLPLDRAVIGLGGGLLLNARGFADRVGPALATTFPQATMRRAGLPPVAGALLKGLALAGALSDLDAIRGGMSSSFTQQPLARIV